jgi:hypothetical protein
VLPADRGRIPDGPWVLGDAYSVADGTCSPSPSGCLRTGSTPRDIRS